MAVKPPLVLPVVNEAELDEDDKEVFEGCAVLMDTPTLDGRVLQAEGMRLRPLPLPVVWLPQTGSGQFETRVGEVSSLTVRAGRIDLRGGLRGLPEHWGDLLDAGLPARVSVSFLGWRLASDGLMHFTMWRISALVIGHVTEPPPWPDTGVITSVSSPLY